jgi:hypothetical protein
MNSKVMPGRILQKSLNSVIPANPGSGPGQAPESRIAKKTWIPGRASLARNDDFSLLPRVLQEPPGIEI